MKDLGTLLRSQAHTRCRSSSSETRSGDEFEADCLARNLCIAWISSAAASAIGLSNSPRRSEAIYFGGHGTNAPDGTRIDPYNNTHTADSDINRRWDGQYPSLWVTDGGGGTFADIWTPSTFAQAGLYVSDSRIRRLTRSISSQMEHSVRSRSLLKTENKL
jgi:hypothetical protein